MQRSSQNTRPYTLAESIANGAAMTDATQEIDFNSALLDIEVNVLARQSSSLLTELINHLLLPLELSGVFYVAMMYLQGSTNHHANPSEISRAIGDTRTNMTRICDELVMKGLMQRESNAEDRRRVDLSLTHKGIALLKKAMPLVHSRMEAVMGEFLPEEKALLIQLLARLNKSVEARL